jgi:pilus assembly protein Flp/PilA
MQKLVSRFLKDQSGATAIEYGLLAALIGVGIIVAARLLGQTISSTFNKVSDNLSAA